ncbi:MAG: hypothetical protein AB1603_04050 [Chloroflexota bacterium]
MAPVIVLVNGRRLSGETETAMWVNRHHFRVLAIVMFAYPEPILTTIVGLGLLSASFFLPEGDKLGSACVCGCDYHRGWVLQGESRLGMGALLNASRGVRLDPHEVYNRTRYGFVPVPVFGGESLGNVHRDSLDTGDVSHYDWHTWPRLGSTPLRRLSGFGASPAVRCEYAGALARSMV